jgi:hypothetical protein
MLMCVADRRGRAIRYETVLMSTVKLQILLKRKLGSDELNRVERLLKTLGAIVTGRGAITLSATMPAEQFEKVFSRPAQGRSGFSSGVGTAATLPVPIELRGYIESISETPPHIRMTD